MDCECGGTYLKVGLSHECDTCGQIYFDHSATDWDRLVGAATYINSDADFNHGVVNLKNVVIPESAFCGYNTATGVEEYNIPRMGRMDAYEVRAKGWKFWSDVPE